METIETPYGSAKAFMISIDEDLNIFDGIAVTNKAIYEKYRMRSLTGYNIRWAIYPASERQILIKDFRANREIKASLDDLEKILKDLRFLESGFRNQAGSREVFELPYIRDAVKKAEKEGLSVSPLPGKSVEYRGVKVPLRWKIGEHVYEFVEREAKPRGRKKLLYGDKKIREKWVVSKHDGKTVSGKIGDGEIMPTIDVANLILFGIHAEKRSRVRKSLEKLKTDDSWKRIAERYYGEYSRKLGIRGIPLKFKRGYTRSGGITIFVKGEPREVRISEDFFSNFFAVDGRRAEEVLKFTIAHELAHIHLEHGKKKWPRFFIEEEADKLAEKISGVSKEEKERLTLELAKKVNEVAGEEVFAAIAE